MNIDSLNLLPSCAHARVRSARTMGRACRTSLALAAVAACATVFAALARSTAIDARDRAEQIAHAAEARDEHRRRLDAEVRTLASIVASRERSDRELPLRSILGAMTESLAAEQRLVALRLVRGEAGQEGSIEVAGSDGASVVRTLASMRPFERVAIAGASDALPADRFRVSFLLPANAGYAVVQGDADVNADRSDDHE
jgi:hypothetical protein